MATNRSSSSWVGWVLFILGWGFLMDNLGGPSFSYLLSFWWPVCFILFGIILLSRQTRHRTFALSVSLIGILLLLDRFNVLPVDVWSLFWPLVLILVGVSMLDGRSSSHFSHHHVENITEKQMELTALFSGSEKRVDAKDFSGGTVTAVFGGGKLDLRKAMMAEDAFLDVTAIFGGVEIIVPSDCAVHINGTPVFGGFEDKTDHPSEPRHQLAIQATAVFGGVEIKN